VQWRVTIRPKLAWRPIDRPIDALPYRTEWNYQVLMARIGLGMVWVVWQIKQWIGLGMGCGSFGKAVKNNPDSKKKGIRGVE